MADEREESPTRGLLVCPTCLRSSMVRTDTMSTEIPAEAGAVVREQVYVCQTPGCGEIVKVDLISRGRFGRRALRSGT